MVTENNTVPADRFSLAKVGEFASGLYEIFGNIKMSESEADKFKYQAQAQAFQDQINEPQYDAQEIREQAYSAGFSFPNSGYIWLGLAVVGVFVVARKL